MFLSRRKNFKYIYGPVSSWRLGRSLGVDLLSSDKKICTFDCVYCQIGPNPKKTSRRKIYTPTKAVLKEIENLPKKIVMDYITISGKGEPTLAKNLGEVISGVRRIREEKIAVITDSSLLRNKAVRKDLSLADVVIAKIDASSQKLFERINKPVTGLRIKDVCAGIKNFRKQYKGRLSIQIMFLDLNKKYFKDIAKLVYGIKPDEIQINTPTRRPAAGQGMSIKPLSEKDIAGITEYFRKLAKRLGRKAKIISLYEGKRKEAADINKEVTIWRRGR